MSHVATVLLVVGLCAASAAADPPGRDGALVFRGRCAGCHGESGKSDAPGARALKVRPLANDAGLARMSPADIASAIRSDAKHRGVGALVGMDDADLDAVAAFVKELASRP